MKSDSVNRWLTLGANFGVLVGILLLLIELNQNSVIMKAQISNERADQGIKLFMSIAESPELSRINGILQDSGFPEDMSAISNLSLTEKRQYYWYLRAQQLRIESVLYQQTLGVVYDSGVVFSAKELLPKLKAFGALGENGRFELLLSDVERMRK
jgi:hypothetical protein